MIAYVHNSVFILLRKIENFNSFFACTSVKRLRADKLTTEVVAPAAVATMPQNSPGPSVRLGKRAHESSQSETESENNHETESNHCSRTL